MHFNKVLIESRVKVNRELREGAVGFVGNQNRLNAALSITE